jgi:hypothetical protein
MARFRDIRLRGNRRNPWTALEAIRNGEDIDKIDREMWAPGTIQCRDGFEFSVIAGWETYSLPEGEQGPFTHVEVAFFDGRTPKAWRIPSKSRTVRFIAGQTVIVPYVPVGVVYDLIRRHGGEIGYGGIPPMDRERRPRATRNWMRAAAGLKQAVRHLEAYLDVITPKGSGGEAPREQPNRTPNAPPQTQTQE